MLVLQQDINSEYRLIHRKRLLLPCMTEKLLTEMLNHKDINVILVSTKETMALLLTSLKTVNIIFKLMQMLANW